MKNKFLTIFLGIFISLFFVGYCSATIEIPSSLATTTIQRGSVGLEWIWNWEKDQYDIKQFKILFKKESSTDWYARYPIATDGATSTYNLRGLEEGEKYEWRLKIEALNPANDSPYAEGPSFETEGSIWEEEDPAQEDPDGALSDTIIDLTSPFEGIESVQEATDAFMEFLVVTGFAIGPILIIYAAFLMLTKQGNPVAIAQAKSIILWTLISLSIMLLAKGIPSVVKDLFK